MGTDSFESYIVQSTFKTAFERHKTRKSPCPFSLSMCEPVIFGELGGGGLVYVDGDGLIRVLYSSEHV